MAEIKIKEGSTEVEFVDDNGVRHTQTFKGAVWDARTSSLTAYRSWVNPAGREVKGRRVHVPKVEGRLIRAEDLIEQWKDSDFRARFDKDPDSALDGLPDPVSTEAVV